MADTWTVVTGGPPAWGDCGSHALRMAEAFWKLGHKVLYIECGGDSRPFRRVLGQHGGRSHTVVTDLARRNFFVMRASRLAGFPLSFPEFARHWGCSRTSARAANFLATSGAARVITFHYNWHLPDLFASARESVSHVYECTDDHANAPDVLGHPFVRRQITRTEKKLLANADLTVFSSRELAEARTPAGRAVVLPMAVDSEHFSRSTSDDPHEKLDIPARSQGRPRVGFVGRVTQRWDWPLVRAAASETPEWQWIIAGPRERVRPKGPSNLHWVGPVRYDDLPAWLQNWDVGIVPHASGADFNRRGWPMKLLEYLAAGLPVVSTGVPAASELAARLPREVLCCSEQTSTSFVEAIRRVLVVPAWKKEAARLFTRQYSWESRARQVLGLLGAPGVKFSDI